MINKISGFETISAFRGSALIGIFMVGLLERRNPTVREMGRDFLAVVILFASALLLFYIGQ